jgi:hypothetical protein
MQSSPYNNGEQTMKATNDIKEITFSGKMRAIIATIAKFHRLPLRDITTTRQAHCDRCTWRGSEKSFQYLAFILQSTQANADLEGYTRGDKIAMTAALKRLPIAERTEDFQKEFFEYSIRHF